MQQESVQVNSASREYRGWHPCMNLCQASDRTSEAWDKRNAIPEAKPYNESIIMYIFPCFLLRCKAAAPAASCVWPDLKCVIGCTVWTCKGNCIRNVWFGESGNMWFELILSTFSSFPFEWFRLVLSFEGCLLVFLKVLADARKGGQADQLCFPACCEEKISVLCWASDEIRANEELASEEAQRALDIHQTSLDLLSDWQPTYDAANACSNATRLTRV